MSQLPKTGVQLVAENYVQFIGQMNSANQSVRDFASQAGQAINRVNQQTDSFDTRKMQQGFQDVRTEVSRLPEPFAAVKTAMSGFFENIGGAIAGKAMEAFGAVTGFLGEAPAAAANFADKMNLYFAVADESAQGFRAEIESLVLQMGKELPVSTLEAADAAIELAKGGLSPATLQAGALRDTLNFASAANLGLAETANIVVKQLGTFTEVGASAEEQADFMKTSMDLLTKAANASTVDVDELADGMLQAGGTAKAVGIDYQDFVTTMGALSPAFSSSAEAGTSFKNFLLRLQPTTKTAFDEMSKLGLITLDSAKMMEYLSTVGIKPAGEDIGTLTGQIALYLKEAQGLKNADIEKFFQTELTTNALYNANGELKTMAEVAGILQEATSGLTDQQKSMALSVIFGNDAMNAAVQLSALGEEGMNAFATAMGNANGVSEMFDATQQGANMAATNFQGTMEALQISIGTNFLPIQEALYTKMNDVATVALNMATAFRGDTEALNKLSPAAAAIVNYLREIDDAYSIMLAAFGGADISYALNTLPPSLASVVQWLVTAKEWWDENVVATGALSSVISYLVESGSRLGEWLISLIPLFQPIGDALWGLWESIVSFVGNLMPFLTDMFNQMNANFSVSGDYIKAALQVVISALVTAIEIISTLLGYIGTTFEVTWSYIGDTVITSSEIMMHTFMAIFNSMVAVVELALELIKAILTLNFSEMDEAYQVYSETVIAIWDEWGVRITEIFAEIWEGIKQQVIMFVENIPLMLMEFAYDLGVWVAETRNSLVTGFTQAWDNVKWVFANAWPLMKEALATFPEKMRTWISDTWNEIVKAFENLWTWDKVGKSMSDGFINGIKSNWNNIMKQVGDLATSVLNAFNAGLESKSPSRAFMRSGKSATDGFVIGIESQQKAVLSSVNKLTRGIVASANSGVAEATRSVVYNNQTTNAVTYNLGVTTAANAGDVISNYRIMEALT